MPIEKKPEQVILSGPEARAAIVEGVQRALGRRIDEKTVGIDMLDMDTAGIRITVDVVGSLKGPKPGGKRKPAKKPAPTPPAAPAV